MAVKSDGQVVIDTRINTNGFNTGVNGMKKQMNTLNGSLLKFGKTLGVVFAVNKLIDFGKEVIDLGSDLQEVQNVVDVTFTTMNDAVDKFARNAAKSAGLSETMAKKYTGTFGAMAKAFDFAEQESFDMATSLTQLAGDVASFYNLTQEEAYTKLKSVFTGETESLKDLGVVMTQSALDAFAMAEGYGKTTKQMTEQEKVALRYAFVLDQLSGASGDFVRTSDGWANQMRILSLNFDSFKANIGKALINIFTPFLRILNVIVDKMAQLSQRFVAFSEALVGKSTSGGGGSPGELSELQSGYEGVTDATNEATKANKKYLSGLDEVKTFSSENSGAASDVSGIGVGLSSIENTEEIGREADDIANILQEKLGNVNFEPLISSFARLKESIEPYVELVKEGLGWVWENVLKPLGLWTIEEALPASIDVFTAALGAFNELLVALQPLGQWLWDEFLQPMGEWAGEILIATLENLSVLFDDIGNWISEHKEIVQTFAIIVGAFAVAWALASAAVGIWNAIAGIATVVTTAFGAAVAFLTSPIGIAIAIIGALIAVGVLLYKNWDEIKEAAGKLKDLIVDKFTEVKNRTIMVWTAIGYALGNVWNKIKSKATSIFESIKSKISGIWESVKTKTSSIWNGIITAIKNSINKIIYVINRMICGMVDGVNSLIGALNSLSFSFPDWIPGLGGQSFGLNIGYVSAPYIPYLASGAVIPPNAPFMAVLGDQKHGTNIEAPLDTIKQAVREVVGGSGGNYRFTAQINRRTLFDEFIEEAKMRQSMTGKSPFELA